MGRTDAPSRAEVADGDNPRESDAGNPGTSIDLLIGGDSRTANKIVRFSPKINDRPNMLETEKTRILIATDVIAKGQNLQDCNRVSATTCTGTRSTSFSATGRWTG